MFKRAGYFTAIVLLIVAAAVSITPTARAVIGSCYSESTPQSVSPGAQTDFTFRIVNTSPSTIRWIKITRPSGNFAIQSFSASGWNGSNAAESVVLTSGVISPDAVLTLHVISAVANIEAPRVYWSVQVSDDPNGANPFNCGGSLGVTISNGNAPLISNISVTNLTSVSATITWVTDEPTTSQVNYDLSDDYNNSTEPDSDLKTSHSVKLTNLAPNTGYHYQALSVDGAGSGSSSEDNTFLTPLTDPVAPAPVISSTGGLLKTAVPLKAVPTENIPPSVNITSQLTNPYKEPPQIAGTASDNEALAGIEYSIDGGKSWLPVNSAIGLGTKQASFEFKSLNLEEGDYKIIVRAIDTSANIGYTPVVNLVIDRLPPIVGGSLLSAGPQMLFPNGAGVVTVLAGIQQRITLSAIGGPTTINLLAKRPGNSAPAHSFALTKSTDNGLWSGILSFTQPGNYTLVAEAVDGANNQTQRDIIDVAVTAVPRVLQVGGKGQTSALGGARLTLYYLDPDTNSWVVWDGAPFSQTNPQVTGPDGGYRFSPPVGTYYLKAEAKGYRMLISKRFSLDKPQAITTDLRLSRALGLHIGSFSLNLPTLWPSLADLLTNKVGEAAASKLVGKSLPEFSLPDLAGRQVNSGELLNKPTILSLVTTWSPSSQEQLPILAKLQSNPNIQVLPIAIQEKAQRVTAYTTLAGYKLRMLVDTDGHLVDKLGLYGLPTHYFLDGKGSIIKVMVGVLSEKELLEQVSGLPSSGAGLGR